MAKTTAAKKVATDNKTEDVLKVSDGKIEKPSKAPKPPKDGADKVKKPKKVKDPNEPKRPATSYILFTKERMPAFKLANPTLTPKECTAEIAKEWKAKTTEEKKKYTDQYTEAKKLYDIELAAYKASKPTETAADVPDVDMDPEAAEEDDDAAIPMNVDAKLKTVPKSQVALADVVVVPTSTSPTNEDEEAHSATSKSPVSVGMASSSAGKVASKAIKPILSPASIAKPAVSILKKPSPPSTSTPAAKAPAKGGLRKSVLLAVKPTPAAAPAPAPETSPVAEPENPIAAHPAEELESPRLSANASSFHNANSIFIRTPSQMRADKFMTASSFAEPEAGVPNIGDAEAAEEDQVVTESV